MRTDIHINFLALIIFTGIILCYFISFFYLKNSKNRNANLSMGVFFLSLALTMTEFWLNYTGYIVKVLWITNFSEPLNFVFGPIAYLYILSKAESPKTKRWYLHFIPAFLWLIYCIPHFMQTDLFKYNSYVDTMHPDWEYLSVESIWNEDILGIRRYLNFATGIHFSIYFITGLAYIQIKAKKEGGHFFKINSKALHQARNTAYHFCSICIIFILVKLTIGRDLGDYFIGLYITFMAFTTLYQIIRSSNYFEEQSTVFDLAFVKYKKSSLDSVRKGEILSKIEKAMGQQEYFKNNMATVGGLAKMIHENSHHVSQVINEIKDQSFFELLAYYRVEAAKKILSNEDTKMMTIEELADVVRDRETSRYLLFDENLRMCGWENRKSGERIIKRESKTMNPLAFSGIHMINPSIFSKIPEEWEVFSLIDLYLLLCSDYRINAYLDETKIWLDIGKPEHLKHLS